MSLKQKISDDIKTAMKAQDKLRLEVLRMLLSEIKYAQAQSHVHSNLNESEVEKIVGTYFKRLDKSLADYPDGASRDKIKSEMEIVSGYLPQKASEAEIAGVVKEILRNAKDRQFGPLMKEVMNHFGNAADGKLISAVLKKALEG